MSFELLEAANQEVTNTSKAEPAYWGQTTDPCRHNPDDFRYLAHAFNPYARGNALILNNLVTQDEGTVTDEAGDQSIDVFKEPERIDERVSLSMSLIDQDHTATWGGAGIIVAVPESSVVLTSPTDAGVPNSHRDHLIAKGRSMGILSPDEILERSSPERYNEIVALGRSGLKAVGFFYKVNSRKNPISDGLAADIRWLGRKMDLPVVEIPSEKQNPYAENKVVRSTPAKSGEEEELKVFFDGRCYYVSGSNEKLKFHAVDGDTGFASFPSPKVFAAAIEFAFCIGDISEDEAERILEDYHAVDAARQTPTAYFDENGKFDRIGYSGGYDGCESVIFLDRNGVARRVQEGKIRSALKDYGLGGTVNPDTRMEEPLSQFATDRMVEAAVAYLDLEKSESIRSWYEQVRPAIVDAWSQQNQARSRTDYRIIR